MTNLVLDPQLERIVKAEAPASAPVFIGPHGGRWADPAHTRAWRPTQAVPSAEHAPKIQRKELLRGNLGIEREQMPQIAASQLANFIGELQAAGAAVTTKQVAANALRATQSELHKDKIKKNLVSQAQLEKPVIVSRDGFLLDGHHRWAAIHTLNPHADVNVVEVDLPIRELLKRAHAFGGVSYKKAILEGIDLEKAAEWALREAAERAVPMRRMEWAGNEDAPRPTRAADLAGVTDEAGLTMEGRKKRKKKRAEDRKVARSSRWAADEFFVPVTRPERKEPKNAQHFAPKQLEEHYDRARDASAQKRERLRLDIERKQENRPPRDNIRVARARGAR